MPLSRLLQGNTSFGPEEIARMVAAYEAALLELDLSRHNPGAETLAKTIITLAKQGERDPVLLGERAIEALSGLPPDAVSA
jgi:hypothetical protein